MFKRTVSTPDTFGMSSSNANRTRARARGRVAAEQGRHRGGPCPAVALATLTGWSYARAERYLKDHGFTGAGMYRHDLLPAFEELLGTPLRHIGEGDTHNVRCSEAVSRWASQHDGIAFVAGHVMPIRNGRLLNASWEHRMARCQGIVLWNIEEEVR